MSKAAKTLFGGTDRSAQRNQMAQNEQSKSFIQNQMGQSRQDLAQGFGGAYNLLAGSMAPQLQAMQQGNVAAQQYLLGGMPAFQSAIMGMPMPRMQQQPVFAPDYSQFQAPQFNQAMQQQAMPQQASVPFDPQGMAAMLGGMR